MNKLYTIICAIVLSGCGNNQLTVEEINKASKYCEDNNLKLLVSYGAWDKKKYKTVVGASCASDNNQYAIPEKAYK